MSENGRRCLNTPLLWPVIVVISSTNWRRDYAGMWRAGAAGVEAAGWRYWGGT